MVRLEHIVRNGNTISFEAYVEDCEVVIPLVLDTEKRDFINNFELPEGYGDCKINVVMAKFRLLDMVEEGKLEDGSAEDCITVMWY